MMDLTLGEIAAACGGKLILKGKDRTDIRVSSVVIDSRSVTEGGVFLATVGERVDGHSFIASVFEKGAVLAVTQKTPERVTEETGISSESWGSYLLVEDTLQALTEEIPMGKIGDADEVAKAAVFLASEEASYITGQVLAVNGGFYI